MSETYIQELMDYNLEYMEATNSEEIFGGDYTSAVDLKYTNMKIQKLQQENKKLKEEVKAVNRGLQKVRIKRQKWKDRYYNTKEKLKESKQENQQLKEQLEYYKMKEIEKFHNDFLEMCIEQELEINNNGIR